MGTHGINQVNLDQNRVKNNNYTFINKNQDNLI